MRTQLHPAGGIAVALAIAIQLVAAAGCDDDPVSAGVDPEIVNQVDNFEFQITDVQNYTRTLQYTWTNSGSAADVNQASSITAGSATLTILDASGTQLYSRGLSENGTFVTGEGDSGSWTIRVALNRATGTLNFRAQKRG